MNDKSLFFYGKCLAIVVAAQLTQWIVAPVTASGKEVAVHQFPPRSHWKLETTKAIGAFAQMQDRPISQVQHTILTGFTLTAYTLDVRSTGKLPGSPGYGITASGTKACVGRTVAVDPHVIPIGSLLYLPHIGWRIAEDSGGAVKGRHIDVLLGTERRAINFGVKRNTKIYLYD